MARHRQESMEGWQQDVRDMAKAERELNIEQWVKVTFEYTAPGRERVVLHVYDFPREMLERYLWVIRWRRARLQCLHPREAVGTSYSHYDKTTGLKTGFGSSLSKLAAAKAQITKARRSREAYIAGQREKYPMFYDPATDPDLKKFDDKLARKEENLRLIEENIRLAVENHRREQVSAS
jgi:hypothetical protein